MYSFFLTFYFFIFVCLYVAVPMPWHIGEIRTVFRSPFSTSTLWDLGIKLRIVDLVVGVNEPTQWPCKLKIKYPFIWTGLERCSAVKSTYYSSRGPKFGSPHPCWVAHNFFVTPSLKGIYNTLLVTPSLEVYITPSSPQRSTHSYVADT